MSYIGSTPTTQSFISGTDYFNGTGSQTAFTLSRNVASVNDVEAVVNNVVQRPNDAYTISGTTITFTSAPSAGTSNIYVRYLSTTTQSITPSQNTVSYATWDNDLRNETFAFKNRLINGATGIWQRGTSFTSVGNGVSAPQYTADRIFGYRGSGWTANLDITQQTGFGQYQNCLRAQRTSGTSSTAVMVIGQIIESVNMYDLQGQSVTLSFNCRAGSNFSGGTLAPQIYFSTAANQTSASLAIGTWTGSTSVGTTITPTTTATQYTFTAAVPSNALSMGVIFVWTPSGTAGANDFLEFAGIQLEKGSTATSFDYRPYGTELALCQRYYQRFTANTTGSPGDGGVATFANWSGNSGYAGFVFPVQMRAAPTGSSSGGSTFTYLSNGAARNPVTLDLANSSNNRIELIATWSTSLTGGNAAWLRIDTNGWLAFSAEL